MRSLVKWLVWLRPHQYRFRLITFTVILLAAHPLDAYSQNALLAQSVPSQVNPGLLTSPSGTMRSIDALRQSEQRQPLNPDEEIRLDSPAPQSRLHQDSPTFMVREIRIEGATLLSDEEARRMAAPYEGRPQTLDGLSGLLEQINGYYREQGYLTTEAFLPPQEIRDGLLRIQVQEGRVGAISMEGNRYYRARVIGRNLSQEPGERLNFRRLEKDLNHINRFEQGYKVKAFLSAGDRPGETDIKLKVAERRPFQITPTFDNQGRYFIGLYRWGLEARNDSLLKMGDRFNARWLAARGTQVGMGSYTIPLNRFGTELSTNVAVSHVDVQLPIENPPSITGRSFSSGVSLVQPLGRERNWQLDAGFNWQRVTNYFEEFQTNAVEVHTFHTGLTYNHADHWGRTFNRVQNTIAFRNARTNNSFWKIENYFNRVIVLPKNNLLILKAYGQWTPDALPAIQQFQIGGANSVRGYTEGVLLGDRGYNLSAEYQFPIPGLKYISKWASDRVQGALFYDIGQVWLDKSNPFYNPRTASLPETTLLQGVGFGFRAQLTRFVQGFIDVGFGLGDRRVVEPMGRQPTARVHFGIRSDLFPYDYSMRNETVQVYKKPQKS